MKQPIGVLYEHPQWFRPLFAELDRRGVDYVRADASDPEVDLLGVLADCRLVVNRMSPSAWARGNGAAIRATGDHLRRLEGKGVPVINGSRAFDYEISKARQIELFEELGVDYPAARAISSPSEALEASDGLPFPVLIKPNVGGSGAGIRSYQSPEDLEAAVRSGELDDLGFDGSALVQEHLPAQGESIVRVEILDGEFLYAIRLHLLPGSFNLCPADYCELPGMADGVSGRGLPVEGYTPPDEVIAAVRRIIDSAGMDLGGVEYLVNARDGRPYFYDVNALSNFVADAPRVIGFDPFVDLVDFIVDRADSTVEALAV